MTDMCHIPVTATYQIINGEPVQVAAEYRDIPATSIARWLLERFNVPVEEAK